MRERRGLEVLEEEERQLQAPMKQNCRSCWGHERLEQSSEARGRSRDGWRSRGEEEVSRAVESTVMWRRCGSGHLR